MWNFLSYLTTATSIFVLSICPSNPSFNVIKAVCIASSIYISALYLFYKNVLAFFAPFPIAVAFQL